MSDMSVEQKLRLVQQVRSRYHENQYDMSNREQILYGTGTMNPMSKRNPYEEIPETAETPISFFGLRFFIAILLLTTVIVMDRNHISVAGITTEKIFQVISADYEDKIEEWVEAMSR